jgi:hypothetical protein
VTFDEQLKKRGFASKDEYDRLVATINLPHKWQIDEFKEWRDRKGTKAELEALARRKE